MSNVLEPLLTVRSACKSYGKLRALNGASLDLFPGELLGLLGPNGAGKTTLISCLAGRAKLDSGSIVFDPRIGRRELLGVVPQSLAIYSDLTASQNLRVFGRLHGLRRAELNERVDEALRWSNLADRRDRLAKTFSGGMQRRLNIACSVMHHPRIVLLDEPTVGVDPQSRERIYEMLNDLRGSGTAILLTTHQLDEAQSRCDRIAIVDQGQVVKTGTFAELVRDTIGPNQQLSVRYHSVPHAVPPPLALVGGTTASCTVTDAVRELPRMLQSIRATGDSIEHIRLQSPTLQQVFLHLTGKELRE